MDALPHGPGVPLWAVERFVGRRGELAVLNGVLDTLRAGISLGVQVVGEPGIGKTRLLGELAGRAQERGYLVVKGRATEFERDLPFGVFVHALDEYLASIDLERFRPELISELSRVFPSLAHRPGPGPALLQEERYRAWRAVRLLLEALSAPRPLVCVLDDIHWADPASAELLSHVLRHPPRGPVFLAVAFRPSQLSPSLAVSLDAASREELAERLELSPLTRQEADELLEGAIDRPTREAIYQESGGNPFYLEQLARVAGRRPAAASLRLGIPPQESVPRAVRSALAEELRGLSRPARVLLEGASVAGDPFELEIAAAAGGGGTDEAKRLEALDELLAAGLVRPAETPRRFWFRHPIVRRGLYSNLGDGWRIGAHRRAATALAGRGASAAARAHHLERSAGVGDEEAIASLIAAAEGAASGAPATAACWYQAAVRLLPGGDPLNERKLALLPPLAEALCSSGQLGEGRGVLLEALEQLPPGHGALQVRLTASCAAIEHLLGLHSEARARLLRALGELSRPDSAETAVFASELAIGALYVPDYEQACRWAGEARAAAGAFGDSLLAATASALLAYGACALGRTSQAEPHLRDAASLLDGLDDARLGTGPEASFYLGWAEQFMERFDDAIRHFERGISVSRAARQGRLVLPLMLGLEFALAARGRLGESQELAEACLEAARSSGNPQYLSCALLAQCRVAMRAGDLASAMRSGAESLEIARRLEEAILSASASWALAGALLEAGQARRARDLLLSGLGGPDLPWIPASPRCLAYEMLTCAELAIGDLKAAAAWAGAAAALAQELGLPVATGAASRARGELLMASGQPQSAADLALAAADVETGAGAPIEAARSRILAGRALAATVDRPAGLRELLRAEEELAACGAQGYRKRAVRELRRLGRRVAPRRSGHHNQNLGSLTPREREIAELVTDGCTNRQIADSLFLSVKTVERHLSNISVKLGARSRVALATLFIRDREGAAS